jgi:hypothetical protein
LSLIVAYQIAESHLAWRSRISHAIVAAALVQAIVSHFDVSGILGTTSKRRLTVTMISE